MITYNHAPYIAQAIEGVLKQKVNFLFELVIGEDCSTDGTRELVFKYQKKYMDIIRVIMSERNIGLRQNCYRTMKACRGKYIAFCEGDDYWQNPMKLQKQVDYLENHPECGLIYSSFDVYDENNKKIIKDFIGCMKWKMPENPDIAQYVGGKSGMQGILTCTVMVQRSLCEQIIESDPYLHQSEQFMMYDPQLWAEIINSSRIHYLGESLATYRKHGESISNAKDIIKRLKFQISNSELMIYLCDKHKLSLSMKREFENARFSYLMRYAFLSRNGELAREIERKKRGLNWREWVWYLGARSRMVYYPVRTVALLRSLIQ
jgi:glycosyltransferase involved in cell wall biosynthesis